VFGAVEVEIVRDSGDVIALVVGLITALATAAAVIVALFGPRWAEARRRPRLVLITRRDERRQFSGDMLQSGHPADFPTLLVSNEVGRDSAREVEVFAHVGHRVAPGVHIGVVSRENLVFGDPRVVSTPASVTHVPAGFARELYFLLAGSRREVMRCFGGVISSYDTVGDTAATALLVHPLSSETLRWVDAGEYSVTFLITGANFNAVRYVAQFRVSEWSDSEGDPVIGFRWLRGPERLLDQPGHRHEDPYRVRGWDWPGENSVDSRHYTTRDANGCPTRGCRGRNWPWQSECWRCHTTLYS
jgi:hypothetical protein